VANNGGAGAAPFGFKGAGFDLAVGAQEAKTQHAGCLILCAFCKAWALLSDATPINTADPYHAKAPPLSFRLPASGPRNPPCLALPHRGSHPQESSAALLKIPRFPASPFFDAGLPWQALIHHSRTLGNSGLPPLRPAPHTPLMPPTFSSRRYNFNWPGFITCVVNLIVSIYSGAFLLQLPPNLLLQ